MDFPIDVLPDLGIDVSKLTNLQKIEAIEYYLKEHGVPGEFPLRHFKDDCRYVREIFLPANSLIVTRVHNFGHTSVISQGKVTIMTEYGIETLQAPVTWNEPAGIKRLIYVHADTIWNTFHVVPKEMNMTDDLLNYLSHNSDLTWISNLARLH